MSRRLAALSGRRRRRFAPAVAGGAAAIVLPDIAWEAGEAAPSGTTSTHTRASSAVEIGATGILVTRATDVERNTHYIGGVRTKLMECQRTNTELNSGIFATGWSSLNGTATDAASTGPDNTASTAATWRETTANANHNMNKLLFGGASMTASSTRFARLIYVKPTAGRTNVRVRLSDNNDNAANVYDNWFLLTGAGSVVSQTNATAVPFAKITAVANGFYEIKLIFVCQATGTGRIRIASSTDGVTVSFVGVTSEGFDIYGNQESNLTDLANWNQCPSSYIATAGSAVTRAADYWYLTLDETPDPAAHSLYTKSVSQEDLVNANGAIYCGAFRAAGSSADSSQLARWDNGRASMGMIAGAADHIQLTTPLAVWGDTLEMLGTIATDGKPTVTQKIGAGAENASSAGTGQAFPADWGGARIYIGCNPASADGGPICGFVKVSLKDGVQTMATMAAL